MTMTSVVLGPPVSLAANMLGPKRYHLQQGLDSPSPTPSKGYETLSKGKKSWSVRLGLSRGSSRQQQQQQQQQQEAASQIILRQPQHQQHQLGWGTVSGGSVLSQQMIYAEPWIYGTVRGHGGSASRPSAATPVLLVCCSCPDFLHGSTRDLGGNCRKCGGHRLPGLSPIGGTCRVPTSNPRLRPSLAGMLRPNVDDPYDLMRRNRLVEPRSRARSSSPLRLNSNQQQQQRDSRSQSQGQSVVSCGRGNSTKKVATVEPMSRTEWFAECELSSTDSGLNAADVDDCGKLDKQSQAQEQQQQHATLRCQAGRIVRLPNLQAKSRNSSSVKQLEEETSSGDSRKSILECDVNPYHLLKNHQQPQQQQEARSEDELSDELSDNALERDLPVAQSFDPSKVKSIERTAANCRSSVAAIGGQRVRVFNEPPREPSDEDEQPSPTTQTRIPIPKISPKRPPRRLKEAKNALKSILKRADRRLFAETTVVANTANTDVGGKRKSVLFNVDNVILAPEKPTDMCLSSPPRKKSSECSEPPANEAPIVPEEAAAQPAASQQPPHRFITIPNIKSPRQQPPPPPLPPAQRPPEAKILPRVKSAQPPPPTPPPPTPTIDKIKIDKFVPSKKQQLHHQHRQQQKSAARETDEERRRKAAAIDECEAPATTNSKPGSSCLIRSQSERSSARPEVTAADVSFVDTMRLSLCRRVQQAKDEDVKSDGPSSEDARRKISFEEARKRVASKRESKIKESSVLGESIEEEEVESREEVKKEEGNDEAVIPQAPRPNSWSSSSPASTQIVQPVSNVCKITVSPRSAPASLMVHRLQVGSTTTTASNSPRGTSIIINGEQDLDNKVTISVGGQDSLCNPTVISVNSSVSNNAGESSSSVQTSSDQKRTLVILDNYKSNIVVSGDDRQEQQDEMKNQTSAISKPIEIRPRLKFKEVEEESPDNSPRWKQIVDSEPAAAVAAKCSSSSSKEEIISKLLEDSLRKARENGEILDESSGEAILKILKQSLLKSSAGSNLDGTTADSGYFRPSRTLDSAICTTNELISGNMFLEENAYEVIKEPIYEEIPDEPPPLPLSPPPSDDFLKNRIFFDDEYRDLSCGTYYKPLHDNSGQYLECSYRLSKSPEKPSSAMSEKLLNFIMDTEKRTRAGNVSLEEEVDEDEDEEDEEEEEEEEEDPERDLEALYEQKETSLGDLSSKSSQISNVSDSSEECNIILTNSPEALKTRTVDIERTDSGVGSESSQASSGRGGGVGRRWRTANNSNNNNNVNNKKNNSSNNNGSVVGGNVGASGNSKANAATPTTMTMMTQTSKPCDVKHCEDCEQRLEPLIIDSATRSSPAVCRKCGKKRAERKEIVTEIVETEQKYGRDLQIILEEFHRPMLRAGLLTPEQLSAIFLNVEELLEHNQILADKLKDAVNEAQGDGDEDLVGVDLGKIFLESERMLHAFESYCTRQGGASLLLQNLEKEKELLRIFLKVSQMENTVLRRMNLNSFLMVPVQRVTKYPLLLARLQKATPSGKPEMQEFKKRLKQAQTNIELHLEHMNAEAKDITSTKLWRRISIIQNGRRSTGEQDMVNIKLRKMAVEVLEWPHEDSRFVLEGRLLVAQPTDNNWRRGRTVKLAPVTAMLVTNGKPNNLQSNNEFLDFSDDSLFPRQIGIKDATLLLVKEKLGRYSLLREPLYLDKCIVCCETDLEDYFEVQELSSKETFIFKAEDGARTKRWCRTLQAHAQSLGAWRRRRGALPNIMICGVARS